MMSRIFLVTLVVLALFGSSVMGRPVELDAIPEAEEAPIHTFAHDSVEQRELAGEPALAEMAGETPVIEEEAAEPHAMIEAPNVNGPTTRNNGPSPSNQRKPDKLEIALQAVKEEIMVRARELHNEKDWVKRVEGLVTEYQQKLKKVTNNIDSLRSQTKELLKKKKQIQNAQIQAKLRDKLQTAHADMQRLQKQMAHIKSKEDEFSETEKRLKDTMSALKGSLLKLRGQTAKKKE